MRIVAMQPDRKLGGAALRGRVGGSIGPFPEGGLDEALGLAIGFRRIGVASPGEGFRFVAGAIVPHDPRNGDTEAGIIGDGRIEKGNGAVLSLIRQDLREGDAGGIVDCDVNIFPADAAAVGLAFPLAVMRWPMRSKRPSFLMSRWIISSG